MTDTPVLKHVKIGRNNGGSKLLPLANNHHIKNEGRLFKALLYHLGIDELAHGGLEHVLGASSKEHISTAVDISGIACMEPSLGIDSFGCQLGSLEVTFHHISATAHDFMGFGMYLDLDARQHETDRAYFAALLGIAVGDSHKGRTLGKAIAFVKIKPHSTEKPSEPWLDGGSS